MKTRLYLFAIAAAGMLALALPANAQDAAQAGAQVFKTNCAVCHSADPDQNRIGPSLFGVVGRKAGTAPNYTYSDAMKNSGLTWTPSQLDTYLTNPKGVVANTKMMFLGLKSQDDRKAVIGYLATLK
jgi:cytochrome c2